MARYSDVNLLLRTRSRLCHRCNNARGCELPSLWGWLLACMRYWRLNGGEVVRQERPDAERHVAPDEWRSGASGPAGSITTRLCAAPFTPASASDASARAHGLKRLAKSVLQNNGSCNLHAVSQPCRRLRRPEWSSLAAAGGNHTAAWRHVGSLCHNVEGADRDLMPASNDN
jgi:hypothetical protein